MIQSRKKKEHAQALEYFLSVRSKPRKDFIYHGWYTISELSKLPEVNLTPATVMQRIRAATNKNSRFHKKTLWQVLQITTEARFNNKAIKPYTEGFYEFLNVMRLIKPQTKRA